MEDLGNGAQGLKIEALESEEPVFISQICYLPFGTLPKNHSFLCCKKLDPGLMISPP